MKLCISNLAWRPADDASVYASLARWGYDGVEIAPTRLFPEAPYEHARELPPLVQMLRQQGLCMPSMQSLLYAHPEMMLFGSEESRRRMWDYLQRAVDFAAAGGIRNLVFGNPKNRFSHGAASQERVIAHAFLTRLAQYAYERGCVIGMEANPPLYGCNYITRTEEAFALCRAIGHPGLKVNLDLGTMLANGEDINVLRGRVSEISHVHISEPMLAPIRASHEGLHRALIRFLREEGYEHYLSIEMLTPQTHPEPLSVLRECAAYVSKLVNEQ